MIINERKLKQAIKKGLQAIARSVNDDLEKTTATFKTSVKFKTSKISEYEIEVSTTNKIYYWLDQGTKKHVIKPKKGKLLAFPSQYRPKTKVKVINSTSGGSSGSTAFTQKRIKHPGTKARKFTKVIGDKWQPRMIYFMQRMIDAGVE